MLVFFIDKPKEVAEPDHDIKPHYMRGHISHLQWSKTEDIWASNDRGRLGLFDSSGNNKKWIETCSTSSGHFTLATVDKEGEHIYWGHNEKMFVKRDGKTKYEIETGKCEPISIFFSDKEKLFYVGKVIDIDAKISIYNMNWKKEDDIHRNEAENRNFFQYPAYLVKNINGDLCVSDNNRRVIVVDNNKKLRFKYKGFDNNGFTPYGICTDGGGHILIVDSSSRCIHIVNREGTFIRGIKMSAHLREPRGLCIDNRGKCYVGTYGAIFVYNFSSDDTQTTTAITASEK